MALHSRIYSTFYLFAFINFIVKYHLLKDDKTGKIIDSIFSLKLYTSSKKVKKVE